MTIEAFLPAIDSPSALVASCPHLLGYMPDESLIAMILGVPGRMSPVIMRADLVPAGPAVDPCAAGLAASVARTRGHSVVLVAWTDIGDEVDRADLPSTPLLTALVPALIDVGVQVVECLTTNGRSWWGQLCPEQGCCPPGAQPLDPAELTRVRAEYVFAGCSPLASRSDVAKQIDVQPQRAGRVAEALALMEAPDDIDRWRRRQVRSLGRRLLTAVAPAQMTTRQAAQLHHGLADVPVRDAITVRLARTLPGRQERGRATQDVLVDAVRCAPQGHAAPAATMLALVAWMRGEGVLATLSVQRAHAHDPNYRLAHLVAQMMSGGLDPELWRAGLSGLTQAQCLHPARASYRGVAPAHG